MIDRLESILKKYEDLKVELTKPETLADVSLLTKLSKEQSSLEEIVNKYKRYKEVIKRKKEDEELLKDSELKDMAEEELKVLEEEKNNIERELEILLIHKDEFHEKKIA